MALLSAGSRGPDVVNLQSMLNGQPPTLLPSLQIDGVFGARTQARVKEFQRNNNLAVDGVVGPLTLSKLRANIKIVLARKPASFSITGFAPRRLGFFSPRLNLVSSVGVLPNQSAATDIGDFAISPVPTMPLIFPLQIAVDGISPDPTPTTLFDWLVSVDYTPADDATLGKPGASFSDSFTVNQVLGGSFTPIFPKIRGGNLTLAARGRLKTGELVESIFRGRIVGTDPGQALIRAEIGDDLLRRIARHESGMQQFETDRNPTKGIVPVFNRGRDGGAGACQVTPPTADDIWDWRANVRSGKRMLNEKRAAALQHLNAHRIDGHFPNNLGLGDDEVILRETIQRFNGGFHWRFNAATNQWDALPQFNQTYVASVLAQRP